MRNLTEKQQIERTTRNLKSHTEANKVKDRLHRLGYYYTISLYGVLWNPETQKHEYRRIEVFLNGVPNETDVCAIKTFFSEVKPYQYYSLWAYNKEQQEIIMLDAW